MLWNTRYTDAAITALRESGKEISEADVARLSPLADSHINILGRYAFTAITQDGFRTLRNATTTDTDA